MLSVLSTFVTVGCSFDHFLFTMYFTADDAEPQADDGQCPEIPEGPAQPPASQV
jgi:hypothetical protein